MIVIYHDKNKITNVWDASTALEIAFTAMPIADLLFDLAEKHPEKLLVWCDEVFLDNLNLKAIPSVFHHNRMMASFHPDTAYLPEAIGYIEESSFIKINRHATFPTWRMSGAAGGIHASVLNLSKDFPKDGDFDYFLNSFAKLAMPSGLFCYSEPQLLVSATSDYSKKAGDGELFRFVKQHYKSLWVWLMLLDLLVYEKRFPLFSALGSLFYKRRKNIGFAFETIPVVSEKRPHKKPTLDVIIPTIGRTSYLYNVLKDLSQQAFLPAKIIIVEQNPKPGSETQLDYLINENWPFPIKHIFIHQSGACNARNLALGEIQSDWIFFADDDIRLQPTFLETAFEKIVESTNHVFNFCCINPGQKVIYKSVHQTSIFGAGCSIISKESLGDCRFDVAFEFGFSEDIDFAMQLMNRGFDTYYFPEPAIAHLKAPVGGFRTKPVLAWANEIIQPKPSPTVMLYKLKHHTKEQLMGYRTILFFKFYGSQPIKNPLRYRKQFRKMWNSSVFWANQLRDNK
jgi:glycosyltransferase involved in cell wall biosynthesis